MVFNSIKKFFFKFIFLIFTVSFLGIRASYGTFTDIEVFDEYQQASSKQYVIKLDCHADSVLSSTHMLECDFRDTFINNFSIRNKNKEIITTVSATFFENGNILSAYVLKSPDLISKLLEKKLRFKFPRSFIQEKRVSLDKVDLQYDLRRDAIVHINYNNINAYLDVGNRFFHNGKFIICRQPDVKNDLASFKKEGLSIQENCKTFFERNEIYFKNTLANTSNKIIYAADKEGVLYVNFESLATHHNHILTSAPQDLEYGFGDDISCAGHIQIKNGKITYLSNNSGHYEPSIAQLILYAKYLNSLNLLADEVIISAITPSQKTLNYSLADLNNFDEKNLLNDYSQCAFPSIKENIQHLQNIIAENLVADPAKTNRVAPFSLNSKESYPFLGLHVGALMPDFPATVSDFLCPPDYLKKTFDAQGITWNATFIGEFTSSDILSHLLAVTHHPDGLLHYHYQVNSPVSAGSKKLGVLSLKGRLQNSGGD